jgi:shikimate kinase
MAAMRSELYRQVATAIIDTDDRAPETVADEVVGLLARRPDDD